MKEKLLTLILIGFTLLTACGSVSDSVVLATPTWTPVSSPIPTRTTISTQTDNGCLPALVNFAYPAGEIYPNVPYQEKVLPGEDWRIMSTVESEPFTTLSLETIQPHEGYDELWVLSNNNQGVFRYRTDTREWSTIPATVPNNPIVTDVFLFLDSRGSVWAARHSPKTLGLTGDFPLLARFDEFDNQFTPVTDSDGLFENSDSLAIEALKVDRKGVFWFIVKDRDIKTYKEKSFLYSYDPSTQRVQSHISDPRLASAVEIAPNGSIFLVNLESGNLINYFPTSGDVKEYKIPVPESRNLNWVTLFLDKPSRLWVLDWGWFDFSSSDDSPQWFTVIRSTVFLDIGQATGAWGWSAPLFTHEGSDGLLWFWSSRGTGWLDTNLGKWCIFTTYRSNVRQDSKGNLWILAGDTLFMKSP